MKQIRRLTITFEPTFDNVDMVRAAVSGVCTDYFHLPCDAAVTMDFCLIVSELMNNAVEHADSNLLAAEILLAKDEAIFRLTSDGPGYDPTRKAEMPDVEQDELPEGGFGLALIQALADGMEYECMGNKNMVTLRKLFPAGAEKES